MKTILASILVAAWHCPSTATHGVMSGRRLNSRGIPIPWYRYRLWNTLDAVTVEHATTLSYTRSSWTLPGSNPIEEQSFESIREESTLFINAVTAIGFNEEVWDCWVNHYGDYTWEELVDEEVAQYYEALGWTQALWDNGSTEPASSDLFWAQLSAPEQAAATELCYTMELWNEIGLDLWTQLPTEPEITPTDTPTTAPTIPLAPSSTDRPTAAPVIPPTPAPVVPPTPAPTLAPTTLAPTTSPAPTAAPTAPVPLPPRTPIDSVDDIRHVVWEDVADSIKADATDILGYDEGTWNLPRTASIENLSYEGMAKVGRPDAQQAVDRMGMTPPQWDCHINHYDYYAWVELEEAGVQVYYRALGWTHPSWREEADPPPTNDMAWEELSAREREAAEALCFRQELWDMVPLTEWVRSPTEASPSTPGASPTPGGESPTTPGATPPTPPAPTSTAKPMEWIVTSSVSGLLLFLLVDGLVLI